MPITRSVSSPVPMKRWGVCAGATTKWPPVTVSSSSPTVNAAVPLDDEHFRVGVQMQRRALPALELGDEDRDRGLVAALEQRRRRGAPQLFDRNHGGHGSRIV
jgi:hypothetical protein